MVFAGIKVPDTALVRDAVDLSRSSLEPFLFNHVMRSWLFAVVLSDGAEHPPDSELLAVAAVLHDMGLTDRYTTENRFEVDGANAARTFLSDRAISTRQIQLVLDATHSTLFHTRSPQGARGRNDPFGDSRRCPRRRTGIEIPQDKQRAILSEFPRLAFKDQFKGCLCSVVRQKPMTTMDNILRDFGIRYVDGFALPNFADLVANAPFSE